MDKIELFISVLTHLPVLRPFFQKSPAGGYFVTGWTGYKRSICASRGDPAQLFAVSCPA
jgi:hypothetical protein